MRLCRRAWVYKKNGKCNTSFLSLAKLTSYLKYGEIYLKYGETYLKYGEIYLKLNLVNLVLNLQKISI